MLGGLAYQSPDYASIKNLDLRNIAEINAETADTATDVFVYDTSKDSDGGAWRQRTQYTSWYNETLNTPTRGSRREFPAVAVIVGASGRLTIYDGDDPNLPMWMVFNETASRSLIGYQSAEITSVKALNSSLVVGSQGELNEINFLRDNSFRIGSTASWYTDNNIAQRNVNFSSFTDTGKRTVSNGDYVVAMTVLPRAPIDPDTGLQVPTIAVGTNSGVSVIKDDGSIVDIDATSYDYTSSISFTEDNELIFSWDSNTRARFIHVYDIPSSDVSHGGVGWQYGAGKRFYTNYGPTSKDLIIWNNTSTSWTTSDVLSDAIGHSEGLTLLDENPTSPANGMVAFATTSYNTGYLHGDIKGAFLSDTDDTDLTGSNLMSGATFLGSDRITSYSYTAGSNTLVINDDEANADGYVSLTLGGLSPSTTYIITVTADNYYSPTTGYNHHIGNTANGTIYFDDNYVGTTTEQSLSFTTATSGDPTLVLYSNYSGGNLTYTIDLRISDLNRAATSVKGWNAGQTEQTGFPPLGLGVYGTIAKTPVSTGADLVAYGPFSGSNYLYQPYNSDLDLGTGDFSIMVWIKSTDSGYVFWRNDTTGGPLWDLYVENTGSIRIRVDGVQEYITTGVDTTKWTFVCFTRTAGTIELYVDGKLGFSRSDNTSTLTNLNAPIYIGRRVGVGAELDAGYLALMRISATAPSAEQIKKIYNDERILFKENAKCTLYGSSDAVTALAYDDSTSLLHVGTSSGRSDFTGLKRINNTTTAVSTAISAKDGLIAQQ